MFYYEFGSLRLIKVKRILSIDKNHAEIQLPKAIVRIEGNDMFLSYIEGKEIIIKGKINKINIEDFL